MADSQKVALITGASRGIGFETARQLGQKDVTVVVSDRTMQSAQETADKLNAEGIDAFPVKLEATSAADREAVAKSITEKFGKLDILVNNAGMSAPGGLFGPRVSETTEEELQTVLGTNLFSVIALTHKLLPLLKKSESGRIVNVSSVLGSLAVQSDPKGSAGPLKVLSYNMSKTALNAFTIHLAAELKDTNIKVNAAHPGWVKTELGTDYAPMEIPDGAKTSVDLALIGPDGPNGRFIHLGNELPW